MLHQLSIGAPQASSQHQFQAAFPYLSTVIQHWPIFQDPPRHTDQRAFYRMFFNEE